MTSTEARADALLRAVLGRITRCGDMPIRINHRTLEAIFARLGFRWELWHEEFREIDAPSLEALVRLAEARR